MGAQVLRVLVRDGLVYGIFVHQVDRLALSVLPTAAAKAVIFSEICKHLGDFWTKSWFSGKIILPIRFFVVPLWPVLPGAIYEMTRDKYYRDLRVTHRFLTESGLDVPRELLLKLSSMIQEEARRKRLMRMSKATEEQLIRMSEKQTHILQITMADGMLIRGATNAQTFIDAMEEIGLDRLRGLDVRAGKHPVVIYDDTLKRRRISGYQYMRPGYFLRKLTTSQSIVSVLKTIDQALELNMSIEM